MDNKMDKMEILLQAEDAMSALVRVLEDANDSARYEARYILNRIVAFKTDMYMRGGDDG